MQTELPNELNKAKASIRKAFLAGRELTTYTGNLCGHTVDFRKIVSVLRAEGMNIVGTWCKGKDGRRYKSYKLETATGRLENDPQK